MNVRKYVSLVAIGSLLAVALALVSGTANADRPLLVAAFGKANLGGEPVYVHTVSIVPNGQRPADVAEAAVAAQGARPISAAEFTATGLKLLDRGIGDGAADGMFHYIADTPVPTGFDAAIVRQQFAAALESWAAVAMQVDNLDVYELGSSPAAACPSLVRECPGAQVADGSNDVGWVDIRGRNTLGVTWYTDTEADIALDLNQRWVIDQDGLTGGNPSRSIDIQTVVLHEFGHAFGLGHEEVGDTVMNASYGDVDWTVGEDDICGLLSIYDGTTCGGGGSDGGGGDDGGGDPPGVATTMSATYDTSRSGPRGRDLIVDVTVVDGNNAPVAGATHWIELLYSGDGDPNDIDASGGPTTTNDNGSVRWRLRNAPGGADDWTAIVYLEKSGLTCDSSCIDGAPS